MINGTLIKERRIQLGMSQKLLANSITNQTTISLLENENRPPSVQVLVAITKKLNLDLNLVTGIVTHTNVESDFKRIELLVQNYKYSQANTALLKIKAKVYDVLNNDEKLKLRCLIAICEMWLSEDWDNAIFEFNQISIEALQANKNTNIYLILTMVETGVAYFKKEDAKKQAFFFNQAELNLSSITPETSNLYWYLFILNNLSKFHSNNDNFKQSDKLSCIGIKIAKKHLTTAFVEDFYYLLAFSKENSSPNFTEAIQLFKLAKTFAIFNDDTLINNHADNHIHSLENKMPQN